MVHKVGTCIQVSTACTRCFYHLVRFIRCGLPVSALNILAVAHIVIIVMHPGSVICLIFKPT